MQVKLKRNVGGVLLLQRAKAQTHVVLWWVESSSGVLCRILWWLTVPNGRLTWWRSSLLEVVGETGDNRDARSWCRINRWLSGEFSLLLY